MPTNNTKEEKKYPCSACGQETKICPMCYGEDDYAKEGQYDGFHVCQNKECDNYQFCCGC